MIVSFFIYVNACCFVTLLFHFMKLFSQLVKKCLQTYNSFDIVGT